jgi:multisubunit Na+/H+ antiporter MnhF subunit
VNAWLAAAAALLAIQLLPGWIILRRGAGDALVGLELASAAAVLILMLLAEGFGRAPFFDLALVLTPLSFGGSLAFARALERWV